MAVVMGWKEFLKDAGHMPKTTKGEVFSCDECGIIISAQSTSG